MRSLRLPIACAFFAMLAQCGARSELLTPSADGAVRPSCTPSTPPTEVCNGIDDDCNGRIDDGLDFGPLGDAIELREGEGETGSCTSCRWAWSPVVTPIGGGQYLARWYLGIYGGAEQWNTFARRLTAHGMPVGGVVREERDVLLSMAPMSTGGLAGGESAVAVCFRDGTDDVLGWQIVHAGGTITSLRAPPGSARCHGQSVFANERMITAIADSSVIHVDSWRLDGSRAIARTRPLATTYWSSIATFAGHAALIAPIVEGSLRPVYFLSIDSSGEPEPAPRRIGIEFEAYARLIGLSDGYLLLLPRSIPSQRVRLDVQGQPRGAPIAFDDGRRLSETGLTDVFVHHPSAQTITGVWQDPSLPGPMHVETLDEDGHVISSWSGTAAGNGYVVSPSITFTEGRVLVAWHDIAGDAMANHVFVREFGCRP